MADAILELVSFELANVLPHIIGYFSIVFLNPFFSKYFLILFDQNIVLIYTAFFNKILPPTIINLDVKSTANQLWFTRTCYISYNGSSDWINDFLLGTPRP